jgi:hypothetical protein
MPACPLRDCGWRHPASLDGPAGVTSQLLDHLATDHLQELQLMVAGASGGHGTPVVMELVQHIDARQVQDAADLVASVLVPQMRARLARDMALKGLRPVDPWPAVQVRRYVWTEYGDHAASMSGNVNLLPGTRELHPIELEDGREPDLYQLELRTQAVPDTRKVIL